jgi:hypothetical protein
MVFTNGNLLAASKPKAGRPPLVGCQRVLIQYIPEGLFRYVLNKYSLTADKPEGL